MPVWKSRHRVVHGRHDRLHLSLRRALLGLFWVLLSVCWSGCGESPEKLLTGRWQEATWAYERLDAPLGSATELKRPRDWRIVHHEAEYWEFLPSGILIISKRDGSKLRRHWRLKARGNVLTIRADGARSLEVYDIKALSERELVLHYDIGMEVRGIARLGFRNISQEASVKRTEPSTSRPEA